MPLSRFLLLLGLVLLAAGLTVWALTAGGTVPAWAGLGALVLALGLRLGPWRG